MKKTILVTGGAGYIGSHTVKELVSQGFNVVVIDNLVYGHEKYVPAEVPFIHGDLKNKKQLWKVFKKYPIDAVIHFAAFAYVGESVSDPSKYFNNNISNTLNLLDTMNEYNVKNIVFSSSCAIYGLPKKTPIIEEEKQEPINPYGLTKLVVEKMLDAYDSAYGTKSVSLRYFNAAGASPDRRIGEWHEPETHAIPLILSAISNSDETAKPFRVFGDNYPTNDGSCIRDYIHVVDLADAHARALRYLLEGNDTQKINLGTGEGTSVFELIKIAEQVSGKKVSYKVASRREGDPPVLVADPTKASRILKWKAKYTINDIVQHAWNWYTLKNNNGEGYIQKNKTR